MLGFLTLFESHSSRLWWGLRVLRFPAFGPVRWGSQVTISTGAFPLYGAVIDGRTVLQTAEYCYYRRDFPFAGGTGEFPDPGGKRDLMWYDFANPWYDNRTGGSHPTAPT